MRINTFCLSVWFMLAAAAGHGWAAPLTKPTAVHGPPALLLVQHAETPVSAMPPQMGRAYVIGIQEELAAHGYRPGPADGRLGSMTVHAIRSYQRDAGLPVTGVASRELLDHLKFAIPKVMARGTAAPQAQPVVITADMVRRAQAALNAKGYDSGPVDGIVGRQTRGAIRQFQADAGLPVTGTLDQTLLALLER